MIQNAYLRKGRFCLKKLVRQAGYFLAAGVIGAAAFIATIFLQPPNWKLTAAVALVITVVTIFLFGKVKKDISTARRIIENQILHIQPAVFQDLGEENATDLISGESSRCSFPASVFFLTPKSLSSIRRVSG
jgi:membrane protein implicated in regulation of membrane protease activity